MSVTEQLFSTFRQDFGSIYEVIALKERTSEPNIQTECLSEMRFSVEERLDSLLEEIGLTKIAKSF